MRILVIDDDESLATMVAEYLGGNGLEVDVALDPDAGEARLRETAYDALVLDVMLPGRDGFEVIRSIRSESDIPILMLTARGADTDRIVGLELGADDYLSKPFNPRELLARLRALIRRQRRAVAGGTTVIRHGGLEIDTDRRQVRLDGDPRDLTSYQFDLLLTLAENAGRVMTRDALLKRLRGIGHEAYDRSIDVHVSRLRAAIEEDPKDPKRILTVRGAGYVFVPGEDSE